ncbi:hypothetical protein CCHL11_00075 [Colletotrichum chlorophyti]|uniref:CFEM domain-containing protein n=1 Tax=Colletotrichum chlorophyti TaxID=708187 RepID=A0A1Q8RV34_9PEZI|nr:hypothetical protein CCHL11_00075 [Colletotrichum chlorophyti]
MKFTAATLALVGLAAAQSLSQFPQCSQECLSSAITENGECSVGDFDCLCTPENFQSIVEGSLPCVLDACGEDVSVNQVLPAAASICGDVITGGGAGAAPSTTAPGAASSAPGAASSVPGAVSSSPRVTSSSPATAATPVATPAATSNRGSVAVTTIITTAGSAVVTTRVAIVTSSVTTRNGTVTAATTIPPVTINGAAVQGPAGVFAAVALGVLAYL